MAPARGLAGWPKNSLRFAAAIFYFPLCRLDGRGGGGRGYAPHPHLRFTRGRSRFAENVPFRRLVFQNRGKYAIIKFIIPGTAAPPRWGRVLHNLPEVFLWNWNGWAKAAH